MPRRALWWCLTVGLMAALTMAGCPSAKEQQSYQGKVVQVSGSMNEGVVTANRLWKCPNCGTVLEKGGLGKYWHPGDPISRVAGTATCGRCSSRFDQADVYGGKYDVPEEPLKEETVQPNEPISVLAIQLSSYRPPDNAQGICEELLRKKHPGAKLDAFYCIGWGDDTLSPHEALTLYRDLVGRGALPDLGSHCGTFEGKDLTGKRVVALFFRRG